MQRYSVMEKAYHVSHTCHFKFPVDAYKQVKKKKASELILIIHLKLSPSKTLSFQHVMNRKQLMGYVPFFPYCLLKAGVYFIPAAHLSQTSFISCVQQPPVACGYCTGQRSSRPRTYRD